MVSDLQFYVLNFVREYQEDYRRLEKDPSLDEIVSEISARTHIPGDEVRAATTSLLKDHLLCNISRGRVGLTASGNNKMKSFKKLHL